MEPSPYLEIFWNVSGKESAPAKMLAELKAHIVKHYCHSLFTLLVVFAWLWLRMKKKKNAVRSWTEDVTPFIQLSFQRGKEIFLNTNDLI